MKKRCNVSRQQDSFYRGGMVRSDLAPVLCRTANLLPSTHGSITRTNPIGHQRATMRIARYGQGPSARTNGGTMTPAAGLPTKP